MVHVQCRGSVQFQHKNQGQVQFQRQDLVQVHCKDQRPVKQRAAAGDRVLSILTRGDGFLPHIPKFAFFLFLRCIFFIYILYINSIYRNVGKYLERDTFTVSQQKEN
jgi:hypothetical protein